MSRKPHASRNDSYGFAERTLCNLKHIEDGRRTRDDVHLVTQYVLSLLGLVVFPWALAIEKQMSRINLKDLSKEGWPSWRLMKGDAETLAALLRHLRNAAAHRRVYFSSDNSDPAKVTITFEDAASGTAPVYWKATIQASDLREFLVRLVGLIKEITA